MNKASYRAVMGSSLQIGNLALSMYSCSMTLVTASIAGLPRSAGSTLTLSSTPHR